MTDAIVTLSEDNLSKLRQGTTIKKMIPSNKLIIFLGKKPPSKDEENLSHTIGWNTTYLSVTDTMLKLIENKESNVIFRYDDYSIIVMSAKTYQKQYGDKNEEKKD